jgi:hypothetical protein
MTGSAERTKALFQVRGVKGRDEGDLFFLRELKRRRDASPRAGSPPLRAGRAVPRLGGSRLSARGRRRSRARLRAKTRPTRSPQYRRRTRPNAIGALGQATARQQRGVPSVPSHGEGRPSRGPRLTPSQGSRSSSERSRRVSRSRRPVSLGDDFLPDIGPRPVVPGVESTTAFPRLKDDRADAFCPRATALTQGRK